MRLFVGIPLDQNIKDALRPIIRQIHAMRGDFSFVPVENLHITVKFLGNVTEPVLPSLISHLEEAVHHFPPFEVLVQGVGAFPHPERISVLWVAVHSPEMIPLLNVVHASLDHIHSEKREDAPHITLVRVKSGRKQGKLQHLLQTIEAKRFGKMTVNRLVLYESILRPEGPFYRLVQEFPLGKL